MKHKTFKLLCIVLLANFLLANFAFAQGLKFNPDDPRADGPTFESAQASSDACKAFSNIVADISTKKFKATWISLPSDIDKTNIPSAVISAGGICRIIDYGGTDGVLYPRSTEAVDFEKMINVNFVSGKQVIDYELKANTEQTMADPVSIIIGWVIELIASIVSNVLAVLTSLAGLIFNLVVDRILNITQMLRAVTVGWQIVRDFSNMFFILIMIVISLATILRIEKYNYRQLLGKLILMALLVNFSQVIAVTIMNAVNLLAATFYQGGMAKDLAQAAFKVAWPVGGLKLIMSGGIPAALTLGFSQIMFQLVATVVFLALAILFLVRLVGLYVLIIFSPIAYVGNILPATQKFAEQWWHTFVKYLIWVPVALFLIRLDILVINDGFSWSGAKADTVFIYFIEMAFIVAAFIVAKNAGMVGADVALNAGKFVGKGVGGFVGRAYSKRMLNAAKQAGLSNKPVRASLYKAAAFLNPIAAKKAWEQRSKQLDEEVYGPAVGAMHDTLNRIMPTEWHGWKDALTGRGRLALGRRTQYGAIEANKVINKKVKEINEAPLTEKQRVQGYLDATHLDDKIAWSRSLTLNNHGDGVMHALGKEYDPVEYRRQVFDDLIHAGASKEQAGQEANYISELSEANRKLRDLGSGVEEDVDGVARATVDLTGVKNLAASNFDGPGGLQEYLKKINVINNSNEFVDREGNVVATINNVDEFNRVLKDTAGNGIRDGKNFEHKIMSARGAKERLRRAKRMDAEDLVKAMEPAGVSIQERNGTHINLSEEGSMFLEGLSPSVGPAVPNMRRTAPRMQNVVGGSESEDGTIDYKSIGTDPRKLNILVETVHSRADIAAGFLTKGKVDDATASQIKTLVNTTLRRYKGSKLAKFNLDYTMDKDGNAVFQSKRI